VDGAIEVRAAVLDRAVEDVGLVEARSPAMRAPPENPATKVRAGSTR